MSHYNTEQSAREGGSSSRYNPHVYTHIVATLRAFGITGKPARRTANYYAKLQGCWQNAVSKFAKDNKELFQ